VTASPHDGTLTEESYARAALTYLAEPADLRVNVEHELSVRRMVQVSMDGLVSWLVWPSCPARLPGWT